MGGNCWWASHSFAFSNISIECKMEIQTDNLCKLMPLTLCVLFVSIVVKQKATAHTHTCTLKHRQRHIWLKALRIRRMGPSNVWHVFFCFAFLAFCFVFFFFWFELWFDFAFLCFRLCYGNVCSARCSLLCWLCPWTMAKNKGQTMSWPHNTIISIINKVYTHTRHTHMCDCVCVCTYVKLAMAKIGNAF